MTSEDKKIDDLMIDYLSGKISEDDQRDLSNLIKSNDNSKIRFDEMLKINAISNIPAIESEKQANFKKILEQIHETPQVSISQSRSQSRSDSRSWFSSFRNVAAIVALVVSISVASFYLYKNSASSADNTFCYETVSPEGSQTKIILPDGTIVWLNSGSSLKYSRAFAKKGREVFLKGEGYFEVTKDKSKPFVVQTDSLNIKVLGTTFNVKSYQEDENVIVDLIEGSVNVSSPKNDRESSITMKPNEKVVFNKHTKQIATSVVDASRSALWTTGKLCFVDATLEQISKDLERKYNVHILFDNSIIKNEVFSGSVELKHSLKEVISYLDVDKKFRINQVGDTLHIAIK